jgi:hypothetical protein
VTTLAAWHFWTYTHRSGTFLYYTDYLGYYFADLHAADVARILVLNFAHYVH